MSFLTPLFLVALVGLAGPVLLHLTRQERGRPVSFPSLMFLQKIPFQETSRRRIRHWLLLCLRLAALGLLVAAFARPFVTGGRLALVGGPAAEEVAILLDRSWSMEAEGRWEQAVEAAREVTAGLRPRDRASLIVFDESPALLHRSVAEPERIRAALDTMATTSLATRLAPAVKLAATTLAASELPRRRMVLISDFQRTAWLPDPDAKLPEGVVVESVAVGGEGPGAGEGPFRPDAAESGAAGEDGAAGAARNGGGRAGRPPANLALADLEIGRQGAGARERVTVSARLINTGAEAAQADVVLAIDEIDFATVSVSVPADGAAPVAFEPFTLTARFTRGSVRIAEPSGGALAPDDRLSFVASPGGDLAVVIVDPLGTGDANLYLRGALGIAEGAGFAASVVRGVPGEAGLAAAAVVVLNGGPFPGGASGNRLRAFVEEGGGLLQVLGERSSVPSVHADFLPASVGAVSDAGRERRLGFVDYDHAVFEAFRGPRSGDFSRASFHRTRSLAATDGQVLARFDDGSPALIEGRRGRGRILVWASGLDRFWNDLALQPVFLPFVHRLTRHLGGRGEAPAWHLAGSTVNVAALAEAAGAGEIPEGAVAMEPGGGSVELGRAGGGASAGSGDRAAEGDAGEGDAAERDVAEAVTSDAIGGFAQVGDAGGTVLTLDRAGIWEIRPPGQRPDHPFALAVNVDIAESDLTRLDIEAFQAAVGGAARLAGGPGADGEGDGEDGSDGSGGSRAASGLPDVPAQDIERGQGFWRYLLAAAFLLMASETMLSNRLSRERIKEG